MSLANKLALVTGALGMAALGWLDDRYELRPIVKLAGQWLIASGVLAGVSMQFHPVSILMLFGVGVWFIGDRDARAELIATLGVTSPAALELRPLVGVLVVRALLPSLPRGQSEFEFARLATAPCRLIQAPRVADSPAAMECRVTQVLRVKDVDGRETGGVVVYGQVIGMHLDERYLKDDHELDAFLLRVALEVARVLEREADDREALRPHAPVELREVSLHEFRPRPRDYRREHSTDGEIVIGTVGHLRPEKRQEALIEACAGLAGNREGWPPSRPARTAGAAPSPRRG